jgi:hypothetical protein
VRDTFFLVGGIFLSITAYAFISKKDFSYLGATLSMGFVVIFFACILTFVFQSEIFSLAVATASALLAATEAARRRCDDAARRHLVEDLAARVARVAHA